MTKRVTMKVGRPYLGDKALAHISVRIRPDLAKLHKAQGRAGAAWLRDVIEAAMERRYLAQ